MTLRVTQTHVKGGGGARKSGCRIVIPSLQIIHAIDRANKSSTDSHQYRSKNNYRLP